MQIVGHGQNSLSCDCSEHVEINMTLLHSGMFGKCEIGHGGATSPPNLTNHQINLKYLLTSTSISQIEKWLKIVLTNEKLIKIIHSIFKLAR
jgi:hypothetical protein